MAVLHGAIANNNVLAGHAHAPPVAVAPALNGDAIVSRFEDAALNQNVGGALRIAAVVIRPEAGDSYAAHRDVAAQHRIQFPHGGIANAHAFNQHVSRAVRLEKRRAQIVALAEDALAHRHILVAHGYQSVGVGARVGSARLAAEPGAARPRPPMVLVALAVQHARAGHGDIGLLESVDQRRVVHAFGAFEPRQHQRQILFGVAVEFQNGAFVQVQVGIGLQVDGAGEELPARHHHASATRLCAGFNRPGDGVRAVLVAARSGAIFDDVESAVRKLRRPDAREHRPHFLHPGGRLVRGQPPAGGRCNGGGAAHKASSGHDFGTPSMGGSPPGVNRVLLKFDFSNSKRYKP